LSPARLDPRFVWLDCGRKAAGLAGTLSGSGPFTVFAPTNATFAMLARHGVPGTLDSAALRAKVEAGGGKPCPPPSRAIR
jgi:uncharacterized surface protein with fasciclin (FAS1) repeats